MKSVLYSLFGVIAGFILAGIFLLVSRAPAGEAIVLQPAPTEAPIKVHVLGGVARPGLYDLPEGARVQDAIDAAGGLITTAEIGVMNLAAIVKDGDQINIPCKDNACPVGEETAPDLPSDPGATPPPFSSGDSGGSVPSELININTASYEELLSLPGIGPSLAQAIVDYRNQNGGEATFFAIEDIMNVPGIKEGVFNQIKDYIITGY